MRLLSTIATVLVAAPALAQYPPGQQGSANMHVLSHVLEGSNFRTGDVDIEQELSRPYAYVSTRKDVAGFDIISLKDPKKAFILYQWRIENPELHLGGGGMDTEYFKLNGRYYYINALQFFQGGPDVNMGAVVLDVTGLPDTTTIKEVRRFQVPDAPGGFHNIFTYKHSDGRVIAVHHRHRGVRQRVRHGQVHRAATRTRARRVRAGACRAQQRVRRRTRLPRFLRGVRSGHPAGQVLRRRGSGGYYVFDVTRPEAPKLLTSITGVAGVDGAHTFTPTPTAATRSPRRSTSTPRSGSSI